MMTKIFLSLLLLTALSLLLGCPQAATDDDIANAIHKQELVISSSTDPAAAATAKDRLNQLLDIQSKVKSGEDAGAAKGNAAVGAATTGASLIPVPFVGALVGLIGATGVGGAVGRYLGGLKWRKVAAQIIAGFENAQDPKENPANAAILSQALDASKQAIHAAMDTKTITMVQDAISAKPTGPLAIA